tara:strand:- start:11928 stop:13886 length:1959 start_codon:yes stop_codon:yes gene_type:complete
MSFTPSVRFVKRRGALTLLAASIAFTSGLTASAAYAESSSVNVRYYDVPDGALAQALNTFAAMSGVFLGGSGELLSGKRTLGFEGEYSTVQALDLLLFGTGLSYKIGKANSIVLIDPNTVTEGEDGITLSPLLVEGGRSSAALGKSVISSSEIESMAGDTTNLTDLLKGNGAVRFSRSSSTSANSASMRPDEVSIHGQSHYQNSYVIDGISANNDLNPGGSEDTYSNPISPTNLSMLSGSSSQSYYVDPDALESVTVYDSNVPVEFGGFLGGVISSKLKRYDGEDYLSVKYAISKDEWDEIHAGEDLAEDLADGDSIEGEYTPEYLKQRYTFTGAQGITDKLGMTFTASRATSAFDQSYVKNIGNTVYGKQGVEYDDTVDNVMARFDYKATQDLAPTLPILESLTHEKLEATRQKQVALPVHYFMVSRLPEGEITRLASRYLAGIPRNTAAYSESDYEMTSVLQLAGKSTVDVSLNTEPKAEYRLYAYQSLPWTPIAAVQLTYLGERLETQLKQRLRSEVQGVYSVRVGLELNKDTNRAELKIQYSSSPARLDDLAKMTETVLAELPDIVTQDWVTDIHAAFTDIEQNRLKNALDSTLLHRLELSETLYGDARYLHEMDALTSGLTQSKLKDVAMALTFKDRVTGLYRPLAE